MERALQMSSLPYVKLSFPHAFNFQRNLRKNASDRVIFKGESITIKKYLFDNFI